MLTPIEIQGITFKTGRGYKKDDVDSFMKALHHDYEVMYKENLELKEKASTLSEGVQYYKNLETTLQKALVLAEKTSEETRAAAQMQAETIEKDAKLKAEKILYEAKQELDRIEVKTQELLQNFQLYKAQFKQIINSQLEMIDSSTFDIKKKEYVIAEDSREQEIQVKPELEKTLDVDKIVVEAVSEEKEQTEKLAQQILKEAEKEEEKESDLELDMEAIAQPEEMDLSKEFTSKSVETEKEEVAAVKEEKTEEDLTLEQSLASSVEALQNKDTSDDIHQKESNAPADREDSKQEFRASAETEERNNENSDEEEEETDLEIRMLQKLLNEIKKNNESASDDEEFEFINTASDD